MRGSLLAVLLVLPPVSAARAQDRTLPVDSPRPTITVPAGTRLHAVLERPLTRRTGRPGSPVYLQLDHPVVVHDSVALPAGTYVEGVLERMTSRARGVRAELDLHLTRIVYGNGYVLAASQDAEGRTGEDLPDPPGVVASTALLAVPLALGAGLGTAGAARAGAPKAAMVAPWIGFGVLEVAAALLFRPAMELDEGTPVALVLREPLLLDARRATAPGASAYLPRPRARRQELCYSPGSPGTPDIVFPGTPATPDQVIPGAPGMPDVVIPGTPGTPPTVVPGMPGTPDSWAPCRALARRRK